MADNRNRFREDWQGDVRSQLRQVGGIEGEIRPENMFNKLADLTGREKKELQNGTESR